MSTFNASIDLGTIGSSLLNFSFSGCTGYDSSITGTTAEKLKNCAYLTGCTALTSYDNTPKSSLTSNSITLTGLTYDPSSSQMRWVHVKAVNLADGPATGDTKCESSYLCQNIQITGIPSYTPTPAPTSQPTSTPTSTPVPTATPTTGDPTTNTPTPTNTNTPTPTSTLTSDPPTITPTPSCITCSTGAFSSGTTDNGFVTHTYCLNLSSAVNGGTITLNYDAQYRLNRFNISDNVDGISGRTSGWVGADNTYTTAPYDTPGNANGSIVFTYNSSRTYELTVDIAPINPLNPQNDNYQFTLICGGLPATYTPTPVVTTLSGVLSGTTLGEVCAGGATTPTLYFAGASIQIGESLYLNSNLTGPVPAGYYYYPSYNTVYNVTDGSTGAVASTPVCPTATPTSTFLGWDFSTSAVIGGPLAITLVDDPVTACTNPEYVIGDGTSNTVTWNFTVYGSNITNATAIVLLSSGFRSELTLNAIFYVRQRISGTFHYRRFELQGSPGDTNVTALPTDVSFTC